MIRLWKFSILVRSYSLFAVHEQETNTICSSYNRYMLIYAIRGRTKTGIKDSWANDLVFCNKFWKLDILMKNLIVFIMNSPNSVWRILHNDSNYSHHRGESKHSLSHLISVKLHFQNISRKFFFLIILPSNEVHGFITWSPYYKDETLQQYF